MTILRKLGAACLLGLTGCAWFLLEENMMFFRATTARDARTLDPALADDVFSQEMVASIFETLYQYNYLDLMFSPIPLLAEDLPSWSKDRKTVTIRIRPGVKFQDDRVFPAGKGRELEARDFVTGIKRLALPRLGSSGWWLVAGKIAGLDAFREKMESAPVSDTAKLFLLPVEGLEAVDRRTLRIRLLKPFPGLLHFLASTYSSPVPIEAITEYSGRVGEIHDHPVGTGPFRLRRWKMDRYIELERNPAYHDEYMPEPIAEKFKRKYGFGDDEGKALPFLDRIVIRVSKDEKAAWKDFQAGRSDVLLLSKEQLKEALAPDGSLRPDLSHAGTRLAADPGPPFFYLSLNMSDPVIGRKRELRQAISSLIDREEWIRILAGGLGRKMSGVALEGIADAAHPGLRYDLDPSRARALLAKAGHSNGKGLPLFRLDMRGTDRTNQELGEAFRAQLERGGIRVQPVYNTFDAYLEKAKKGELQISYGGWELDFPEGENVFQLLYGPNRAPGPNEANFDHPELNRLFERMAPMKPGPERAALMARMDEIIQEECPWALGYHHESFHLVKPWVVNYRGSEMIRNRYKYFRMDPELKRKAR